MSRQKVNLPRPIVPTDADAKLAQQSSQRLSRYLSARAKARKPFPVRLESENDGDEPILIPDSAIRMLNGILAEMAKGNAVSLTPVRAELTTRQAADLLGVSRPFLIEQTEKGLLPCRKVGTHRRILYTDLLKYKQSMHQHRLQTLEQLSAVDQELGLGY